MNYCCSKPVLLLFFNRPNHARRVLSRLRMVRPSKVYVHCDGPRVGVAGESEQVAAVRALLSEIDWDCAVETLFRDQNEGLRGGVSGALRWFFEQEEMGIVLEDDCLPDVSFFRFCDELLELYQNDARVMHISGSNLAKKRMGTYVESYFFSSFSFVWGWASWRRAWEKMTLELDGLQAFERENRIQNCVRDHRSQVYLLDKFHVTQQKRNNSWAYAWFYSILRTGGVCIVPVKNLVQNTGIGESGATHTRKKNDAAAIVAEEIKFPLIHPNQIQILPEMDQYLFYLTQKSRPRLLLWYFLKRVTG